MACWKTMRHCLQGLLVTDGEGVLRQTPLMSCPWALRGEALQGSSPQHAQEHGELCPAGRKPGSDTAKPNMSDSKRDLC